MGADESTVADVFGDFDSDMGDAESSMNDSLRNACVLPKQARKTVTKILQPTFIEASGRTITDYTNHAKRYLNVIGLSSLDFRTPKADEHPLDFCKISDRHEVLKRIDDLDLIRYWEHLHVLHLLFGITLSTTYNNMDGDAIRVKLAEGGMHLNFSCRMYRREMRRGKFFLHEHLATAMSWSEEPIEILCKHIRRPFS